MNFASAAFGSRVASGKVELSDKLIHSCIIVPCPHPEPLRLRIGRNNITSACCIPSEVLILSGIHTSVAHGQQRQAGRIGEADSLCD